MMKLQIPDNPVKWVFLDNSDDPIINQRLSRFLLSRKEKDYSKTTSTLLLKESKGKYDYGNVHDLYNLLLEHVEGNWLSLEDDVIDYPSNIIQTFYREILSNYDTGIVSINMQSRRGYPTPLVWNTYLTEDGGIGLKQPPINQEISIVDAVHTGCTLIRPIAYSGYSFRKTGSDQKIIGHDIHLCLDIKEKGLFTKVLWGITAGHASEEKVLYPKDIFETPNLVSKNPLVSVITPTIREETLKNLLEQMEAQTYTQYEHLICSDGPNSKIAELVESRGNHRNRYFEMPYKYGFSGAPQRNAMLKKAAGDLVVFIDDDVSIENIYLRTMVNMWKMGNQVGFAQIRIQKEDEPERIIPETRDMVNYVGHLDTLCGFVDTAIAKGFSWDLFEEHDYRYYQQVISFTKNYSWQETIVGKCRRSLGRRPEKKESSAKELVQQLSRSISKEMKEAEPLILTDPQATLNYILNCKESKPWPQANRILASNLNTARFYWENILKGAEFPEAEELFRKDPYLKKRYKEKTGIEL
jgi:glycosyltransferase involved in cell wall biosynthesis